MEVLTDYFKKSEKKDSELKLGAEFEHFIIDSKTLRTISYYEERGIENILKKLLDKGWKGKYEGEYLIGLERNGTTVTLEPGAQIELSVKPHIKIENIEKEYLDFLKEILPILEELDLSLIAIGYQPETRIEDIKFIPKKRYDYMSNYFKSRGTLAHNMMKGTASTQVTLDYRSEEDYIKKFRVANALASVSSAIFDNGPFFQGELWNKNSIRTKIWQNTDEDRCNVVKKALNKEFGYRDYAEYLLNTPPILVDNGMEVKYTDSKPYKDIFDIDNYTTSELEHIMTMVFPDVRSKKFIEIRMVDSLPYPLNFSVIALFKGLLYSDKNLNKLYEYTQNINNDDIVKSKLDIIESGIAGKLKYTDVWEVGKMIIELAKDGLPDDEKKYIDPIEDIIYSRKTPAQITKDKLEIGKSHALSWCILNNILRGE